jgi:CRISPR-associated endonuclease Cas3-HD
MPLADCIARPDAGTLRFGLTEHLEAVARGCGGPDGPPEERLAFLAGLLHDAAKAVPGWQRYIRPGGPRRGPPHAPLGAALFAFWADDLIPRWISGDRASKRRLFDLALDWTRVVYDHHGGLDDLGPEPPWFGGTGGIGMRELFDTLDQAGLTALVRRFFADACDLAGFPAWLGTFDSRWRSRWQSERGALLREVQRSRPGDDVPLAEEGLRLAKLAAVLVYADRSHAADWEPDHLPGEAAAEAIGRLEAALRDRAAKALGNGASPALVAARGRLNAAALAGYRASPDVTVFALLLPTGFGKTLGGLRIALEACRTGRCRRIVYVAPYLSILSQAAREVAEATGLEVFVHHHLTAATLEDHQPYDPLDTWQVPVVATTFNQLFRALFPSRAQQCLRRPALDGAFILVDEPQIIGKEVWNLFLRALAVACRWQRCQALLMTATLPPADAGLGAVPVELVPRADLGPLPEDRYVIGAATGPWDAERTADETRGRLGAGGVAVILNTVRDACDVYRQAAAGGDPRWRFLAAAMLPGHKARTIADVRRGLAQGGTVGVVCTQVLEAGVDLSFRSLLRALPVFPSVVQAAGRANRHGADGGPAEVVVFDYRRADGRPSRQYIYTSDAARVHTDSVLGETVPLPERGVPATLGEYFRRLWASEPATAPLGRFDESARGAWSALAGLVPFDGDDAWRAEVFVPHTDGFLEDRLRDRMSYFAPLGAGQLLTRAQDPAFRRSLSFRERKQLAALLRQFTVALPKKVADRVAGPTGLDWLRVLDDPALYSAETGLAHLLGDEADDPAVKIL